MFWILALLIPIALYLPQVLQCCRVLCSVLFSHSCDQGAQELHCENTAAWDKVLEGSAKKRKPQAIWGICSPGCLDTAEAPMLPSLLHFPVLTITAIIIIHLKCQISIFSCLSCKRIYFKFFSAIQIFSFSWAEVNKDIFLPICFNLEKALFKLTSEFKPRVTCYLLMAHTQHLGISTSQMAKEEAAFPRNWTQALQRYSSKDHGGCRSSIQEGNFSRGET